MAHDWMNISRYNNIRHMSPRAGLSQSMQELMSQANGRELIEDSRGNVHTSRARAIMANQEIESQNGLPDCTHGNAERLFEEEMRRRNDEAAGEKE